MSPKNSSQPTDSELEILNVLWADGPATVRQVHERIDRPVGYTTILKLLQIMTDKGLVVRDESERSHVYAAKQKQQATQKRMVKDLLDRCFSGAADQLILHALSAKTLSDAELSEIRTMIEEFERKRNL